MSAKYECKLSLLIINQVPVQHKCTNNVYNSKVNSKSVPIVQQKIQKLLPSIEIFQFLTNFRKFFSNSKFNLLYAENKFRICYKSTLEQKINYNLKIFRLYQFINSNINHSNMRGVNQKFEIMFQIPIMAI